jgi:hypothetical protein
MWRIVEETDDVPTRVGYIIADASLVLFAIFMIWGLFLS